MQKKAFSEGSNTPRFNFLPGDYEMLQVAKSTDSDWVDPLSADIGNRVAFLFYYHNGILDSVAHNTTLRVDLPEGESTSLVAGSSLWSDETAPISDTVVNGQVVGRSGATINLPTPGSIEYVSGSTKWYPNGSSTPTQMPDGITTSQGLNIGSIQGCWQYAGFVTFLADIKAQKVANLVIDKTVAHPGDTTWHEQISANPGDSVAYHLGIRNDGNTLATNVTVVDRLPQYMTIEPGTTYYYTKDHPEGVKSGDTIFASGISLPDMLPGQENVVYVTYRTKISTSIPTGAFTLVNLAEVFMGGVKQDQDQATVIVSSERGLVIDKKVSNGASWVEQNTAQLGDVITYRIIVRNTGNVPISNVYVRDVLPVFVTYTAGSTTVDGVAVDDRIITQTGLNIGALLPGQQKTIVFSGIIRGCPPVGGYDLVNTAYTRGDSVTEISDSAVTVVSVTTPGTPNI